ncbi:MAG: bifunctional DNA-formamidopyrimidine glycosylase/DNA-(apurinic or apyrimidinic site) lyase [Acidobacteria bacterium]|nr:bifunctional DNA-formamidopyrimidine glycosylase/DNA-(apurinic or apyrimidinic site) lyase [Acidobacteriota bacterium]
MPELPEVETIARRLRRAIPGRTIARVSLSGMPLRRPVEGSFIDILRGRKIIRVHRRGKYLVIELEPRAFWVTHLGMSGRIFFYADACAAGGHHTHATVTFSDGAVLEYRDPRRFGLLAARESRSIGEVPELARLGKDPLSRSFNLRWLEPVLRSTRRDVKSLLLDQSKIAGLGNIYVCEALFHARIHPARRCDRISRREMKSLIRAISRVLRRAIQCRGTTFSDFAASDGSPGGNQRYLRVFRREGLRCRRCRSVIARVRQGNRSSYYCPGCQN